MTKKNRLDELAKAIDDAANVAGANMLADMGENPELLRRVLNSFDAAPRPTIPEIYVRFKEME